MFAAKYFVLISILAAHFLPANFARVLVYPLDVWPNAQFHDMVNLASIIAEHGHEVTVLTSDKCISTIELSANMSLITYPIPGNIYLLAKNTVGGFNYATHASTSHVDVIKEYCESLLKRKYIVIQLQLEEFDLFVTDYSNVCSRVLVDFLQLPTVLWFSSESLEEDQLFFPASHLSFSTMITMNNDWAGWIYRLRSTIDYLLRIRIYLPYYVYGSIDEIKYLYNYNLTMSVADSYIRTKPLLFYNTDFSFDFPRPLMPNVVTLTGNSLEKPSSVSEDITNYLNGSVHDNIIVTIKNTSEWLSRAVTLLLIKILAKLPQRVLLESTYDGNEYLSSNIHQLASLANQDAIINTDIKLLITDCNTKWMQTAVTKAVPILGLSFLAQDWHKCNRMISKHQNGIVVDAVDIDESKLELAVRNVLDNKTFKQKADYLAALVADQPISSKRKFLFWIDYVIRHKGVRHLYNDFVSSLPWYEYHALDIFAAIFFIILLMILMFVIMVYIFLKKVFTRMLYSKKKTSLKMD